MIKTVKQIVNDYRERRFRMWCLRMYLRACGNHYGAKMPVIYQYVKEGKKQKGKKIQKKVHRDSRRNFLRPDNF